MYVVPFNKPVLLEHHLDSLRDAVEQGYIAGNGSFTKRCERLLCEAIGGVPVRLVTSATHALETAALLLDLQPGDEVIVPSFAFVSTANAFALRGATLRFADNDDVGNIMPSEIERLLTPRTRAVVVLHYGGTSCDMDAVLALCQRADVTVIEDAAQAIGASYRGRPLGTLGELGCFSFHETKNVTSGEGGAILLGNRRHLERTQVLLEKGTDRSRFLQGLVDKYTWVDIGSSYVLSELNAAYLYPQLLRLNEINARRRQICERYAGALADALTRRGVQFWQAPAHNGPNHHLMALVMPDRTTRDAFITFMKQQGVCCPFHYVPLHSSPYGARYAAGPLHPLPGADRIAGTLVRLPLYFNMTDAEQDQVIGATQRWLAQ